jgi:glycosyltransferase involved in cell wall biosynthesis
MNATRLVSPISRAPSASDKIHILEVLGNAIVGGMENYVRNLIVNLPADEFEVTVLCPFESAYTRLLREEGWAVYIAPLRDDPPWRSIELICSLVRQHRIGVIHAHLMNAHTVAALAGSLMDIPTVATMHGMSLHPQEISLSRLTNSSLILVCREAWSQAVAVGCPLEDLTLIPNGVDLTTFHPNAAAPSVFRDSIGVGPDDLLIGFVGRLAWEKGPDKFIKAAQLILSRRPSVHFALAGAGPMETDLKLAIENAGIGKRVHLAGVWNQPQQVYNALDLMLHTSRADAMPLVILEGLACGVPIVAIGVGGIPELIETGETGVLIGTNEWPGIVSEYPGDWEGVAKAAVHLVDNPALLKRMAGAAAKRAVALYDIRHSAKKTAEVFRHLVRRPVANAPFDVLPLAGASVERSA